MTGHKFKTKFKFFPSDFVVHTPRQLLKSFNHNWYFNQQMVHVNTDASLLLCQIHAVKSHSKK